MTTGPTGPLIDLLSDVRYELLVLNDQMRELRQSSSRVPIGSRAPVAPLVEPLPPIIEVLPAPVILPAVEATPPVVVDYAPLLGALQGINQSEVVNSLGEMRKDIADLTGVMRAIGMGDSSYGGGGGPSHVTAEVYSKAGLTVSTEEAAKDARYEWQTVGSESKPLYIGLANPDSSTSDEVWSIQKYTYSGSDLSLVQTRSGSWDDRATLF